MDNMQDLRASLRLMALRHFAAHGSHKPPTFGQLSSLHKLFDKYRDDVSDPDKIGTTGTMQYLQDLGLALDEVDFLAVLAIVKAPTIGELNREGFVQGWTDLRADTLAKQREAVSNTRHLLKADDDYFRITYRWSFQLAKPEGQRVVPLDTALEFWKMLFGEHARHWSTANVDWLAEWTEFLEKKWKKSVSKDMWDQTAVFAGKCMEDDTMSWWSEDQSWPGVLDEFVVWIKEKRKQGGDGAMDLDAK